MNLAKRIVLLSVLIYSFIIVQRLPSVVSAQAESGNQCENCQLSMDNCRGIMETNLYQCYIVMNSNYYDCLEEATGVHNNCTEACENNCGGNEECLNTCLTTCSGSYNIKVSKCIQSGENAQTNCENTAQESYNTCRSSCHSCVSINACNGIGCY